MEYYCRREDRDGIRFAWNIWPNSAAECKRLVVPLSCIYAPLKKNTDMHTIYYEPLSCKFCSSYLNPFCKLDIGSSNKSWICAFCFNRNIFPASYSRISHNNLPSELMPDINTIEYSMKVANPMPPIFFFVLDIACGEDLQNLVDSIVQVISQLPKSTLVGLMTFGSIVNVYDLSFSACVKRYIFSENSDVSASKLVSLLRLKQSNQYVLPLEKCEQNLLLTLEQIRPDSNSTAHNKRPLRATGVATSIAISIMGSLYSGTGGRILLFMGGACTVGPGMIVSEKSSDMIRSHSEIVNERAPKTTAAASFFEDLARRSAMQGHAIDLYSCCMDQTGLLEMKALAHETSGIMILADNFASPTFQKSLQRIFERENSEDINSPLCMGLNAVFKVLTSPEIKVMGAIGHLVSLGKKAPNVSNQSIGIGGTNEWKICSLDPNFNVAVFFQVVNKVQPQTALSRYAMIQFCTTYQHSHGHQVMRITTCAHNWMPPDMGFRQLISGFDQSAAAIIMARLAVFKNEYEYENSIRWLDKNLIAFLNQFSQFNKGDPESLSFPEELNVYHQFFFYLRRGPLIQVFNHSPDETVFFRFYLQRENVSNCLIMIQPALDSYTLDSDPIPVPLSANSITSTNVLILDTYFLVLVHFGQVIAKWRDAHYHLNPEYENLKTLLETPLQDAADLISSRMPYPSYIECDQETSQARFLLAVVDPNITPSVKNASQHTENGQVIFTDDVNLKNFGEHLKKRVVEYEA